MIANTHYYLLYAKGSVSCAAFGLGWIRDIWRIPDYVRQANKDHAYVEVLKTKQRVLDKPSLAWLRMIAAVMYAQFFAAYFGAITSAFVDADHLWEEQVCCSGWNPWHLLA